MKYVIVPKERIIHATIESVSAENALSDFASTMDTDMNKYFVAVTEDEYNKLCYSNDFAAHKRFVIGWMENVLKSEFYVLDEKMAEEIANNAYEMYAEGDGRTEYGCLEDAYEKASKETKIVENIEWDWNDEDLNDIISTKNIEDVIESFNLDPETAAAADDDTLLALCREALEQQKVLTEDIFGLPKKVEVSATLFGDDLSDYLTETYGFCIRG